MRIAPASACLLAVLLAAAAPYATEATLAFGSSMPPEPPSVRAGQPLLVVNADPATTHHPFVHKDALVLDAGDLPPGTSGRITFPKAGRFTVICAIHPHMRTDVVVEQSDGGKLTARLGVAEAPSVAGARPGVAEDGAGALAEMVRGSAADWSWQFALRISLPLAAAQRRVWRPMHEGALAAAHVGARLLLMRASYQRK